MLSFSNDSFVDTGKYEEYLRYRGYIYIDTGLMRDTLKEYTEHQDTLRILALDKMNISSSSTRRYSVLSRDTLLTYLIDDCNIAESSFRKRGTKGLSLDSDKVLVPLMTRVSGYTLEVLEFYTAYTSLKSKNGRIRNVVEETVTEEGTFSKDGASLARLNFSVSQQENLRYNYRNEDIISLAKDYKTCTVAPAGYVLAWGDYAQSDWRIAYNLLVRDERNAPLMDACADKYEGIARVLCEFYNEDFDIDSFKANRSLYKVYVLQTVYGQRNGLDESSNEFIHRFTKYLETCPRYMKFYTDLEAKCVYGGSIEIMSYFGFKQILPSSLRSHDAINKALNTPNQTGTSEIIILSVNAIMDKFMGLGYTQEDIAVYFVRHDEPIFILKEHVLKDAWVFEDCSDIYVDDWTPLKLTFEFGDRYGEASLDLQAKYEVSVAANASRIVREVPEPKHFDYNPIPRSLTLSVCAINSTGGKILLTYYAYEENKATFELVDAADFDTSVKILEYIVSQIQDFTIVAKQQGYGSIDCNALFDRVDFGGVLRVVYHKDRVFDYNKALILGEVYLRDKSGYRYESLTEEYAPYFNVLDTCGDLLGLQEQDTRVSTPVL